MVETQSLPAPPRGLGLAVAEPPPETWRDPTASRSFVIVMLVILGVTLLGNGWTYLETCRMLRAYRASEARASGRDPAQTSRLAREFDRWTVVDVLVPSGIGLALTVIALHLFNRREGNWARRLEASTMEWDQRVKRLRLQLEEKAATAAQSFAARRHLEEQLAKVAQSHALVVEELNRRKQAEKALSQQRQELARSKDVLELHVQARTVELQQLQRRYESILNSAGEGICGVDAQGRITFANPAAAKLMDYEINEMIGQPEALVFSPAESSEREAPREPHDLQPKEVVLTRRNGSCFAAEFVQSPIRENSHVVGRVLLFKDITERMRAGEALSLKAAELARSNAELEQFAFVASHDLQEPLRKILAFGDRLKLKCDAAQLGEGGDFLDRMQNAAARMQRLINDLLTFSRTISRSEPFQSVDLGAVTREVLGDLEVLIEKTKASVEVSALPTIEADPTQIRQLLQNLVSNALKFQSPGATAKIRIEAKLIRSVAAAGHTSVFSRQSVGEPGNVAEEWCELSVQDNGIGFDVKYLDRIFVVFQRLHGRQEYEGTGIGLAVCRRIVDRHGGTITARSQPGAGATFIVSLPVKQRKTREAAA